MFIQVAVPGPFLDGLSYRYDGQDLKPLMRVEVPIGRRKVIAVVTQINVAIELDIAKIKSTIQ